MNLDERPPWSKGALRRLGEALVIDRNAAPPEGCPHYRNVMRWHNELSAEVAARIASTPWIATAADELSISARPKTELTLVQKLQRTNLKLGHVQDLAGVRVDADIVLTQQMELALEIASQFGCGPEVIRDIRAAPHSGYRGVHVWLSLLAGRVEVQVRTLLQSEWANAYEGIGEVVGRGIRYGEKHDHPGVQNLVDQMQVLSMNIAGLEEYLDKIWQLERGTTILSPPTTPEHAELLERISGILETHAEPASAMRASIADLVESFRDLRRMIDQQEV